MVGFLALSVAAAATSVAEPGAKSGASVVFDHRGGQRTAIHQLSLGNGQEFDVVINNTAEDCFDYSIERVESSRTALEAVAGAISLAPKVLSLKHEEKFGGYIVSVQRRSSEGGCGEGEAGRLKDSTIIVSVETPGWEVEVSGGFTASGLTNAVYGTVKNQAGDDIVVLDDSARDDASLGVASFLHVYHKGQPWWTPSLGFGLGINETSKPTYHLGAFWRLGRTTLLGGGIVLGSVDRLPVGVEVGGALSDPNLIATLPTRVEAQWFVGISFSFLGGKEPFEKPFAPPQEAKASARRQANPSP
jgi:hypothetical protein